MSAQLDEPRWLSDGEQQSWRAYLRGSRFLEEALDRIGPVLDSRLRK